MHFYRLKTELCCYSGDWRTV